MIATLRILLAIALAAFVWLMIPSSLFFRPDAVTINGYQVAVTRTFPMYDVFGFERPIVRYVETVRDLRNQSQVCADNNGIGFRYTSNSPVAVWSIEEWAAPCMTGSFVWAATWQVKLFGIIPLRPVELSFVRVEQ